MISPFALTIIKTFETFEPKVYPDAVGVPTIGYGHVIKPGEDFPGRISESDALIMLKQDVFDAENAVDRLAIGGSRQLDPHEREALVSWTFNLGAGNLAESTMLRFVIGYLNAADVETHEIAEQMIRWVHAGGVRLGGLVRRRHCEAIWYMGAPDEIVLSLARKVWR
jgi:GH24 family phage-related lysozyme (muramidase)